MKKLISGFILGAILSSTTMVGAAGSITADDASQVKFVFDGQQKTLPNGYTAIMYQDHVYVPARFVAEQLGASVGWGDSTQTVSITSNNQQQLQSKEQNDINTLKLYNKVSDYYQKLSTLNDIIRALSSELTNAYSEEQIDHNISHLDDFRTNFLNVAINNYNQSLSPTSDMINEAKSSGIDISDMNTILNQMSSAINNYKAATNDFYTWYSSNNNQDYINIWNDAESGFNTALQAAYTTNNDYKTYFNKIQNY